MRRIDSALCLMIGAVIWLLPMLQSAKSAENEANNTLRTTHSTYTISETPEHEYTQCLFRNGERLFCSTAGGVLYFGEPVKTRSYTLLPISDSCGGNGCPSRDVRLVVERGSKITVKNVVEDCYWCELTVLHKNARTDTATFKIGNKQGYRLVESFRRGTLSVHRSKITSKIDARTCSDLHETIKACASSETRPCFNPYNSSASGNRMMLSIENDHPSFSRSAFNETCDNICGSGKEITYRQFSSKFCRG